MELRQVRTFLALAEELHFGRTARRLCIAQSAVSQTIRSLEDEIGAQLFARSSRHVALTPAGAQFMGHARRALDELQGGAAAVRHAASGVTARLLIRFTLMSSLTVLTEVVARFRRDCPWVRLLVEPGGTTEQLEAIRARRCDIGFMSAAILHEDIAPLATAPVERAPLVAVVARGHRLARRPSVALGELAGEPFIFLREASEPTINALFRRRCAAQGFEPSIALEVDQIETLLAFVAAGAGVSCAPAFVARLGFPGVITIPLTPEIRGGIVAVWDPAALAAPAAAFLDVLRRSIASGARPGLPDGQHETVDASQR